LVEVELENLFLAQLPLDLQGQWYLLEFAGQCVLTFEGYVLGHLHGDRAAAAAGIAADKANGRAQYRLRVDAVVVVKTAVLARDRRVDQQGRKFLEADGIEALVAELRDELAIAGENAQRTLLADMTVGFRGWQLRGQIEVRAGDDHHRAQAAGDAPPEQV